MGTDLSVATGQMKGCGDLAILPELTSETQ